MSGTDHDGRLRLVPLVSTLAGISKPTFDLDQIFDLAMKNEVRLYVQLPTDSEARLDISQPMVTHRRSNVYHYRDVEGLPQFATPFSMIHPEVTHVVLDPDQAEELRTHRISEESVFSLGLALHPDSALAQAGWWVPCQFGASLVIYPAAITDTEKRRLCLRPKSLKTMPEDVFIDERVIAMLEDEQASIKDDPYSLCRRAPGVYVLYRAAALYDAALKNKQITIKAVHKHIVDLLPGLGKTNASHVAKLINPRHRRGSGAEKTIQKKFDADILDSPKFKASYMRENFVNEALALVLYVTDKWLDSQARFKTGASRMHLGHGDVDKLFETLGFYKKESLALTQLVRMRKSN